MPQRLYIGRLAPDATQKDVEGMFANRGRLTECRVMTGFGFVEFDDSKDAADAVAEYNGKQFMGQPIIVEFARESRRARGVPDERRERRGPPPSRRPPGHRVYVSGISRDTSWQDLKDFGREAGNVTFADIDRDYPGSGVLEYPSYDDAEYAVRKLDGRELRGVSVRVEGESRSSRGGSWRDSGRERYEERDRYEGRDRYDDRYRDRSPRRSRSPRRDDYRKTRSPSRREEREEPRVATAEPRRDDYRSEKRDYDREARY